MSLLCVSVTYDPNQKMYIINFIPTDPTQRPGIGGGLTVIGMDANGWQPGRTYTLTIA